MPIARVKYQKIGKNNAQKSIKMVGNPKGASPGSKEG